MASKQRAEDIWPPMAKVLQAIERKQGHINELPDQNELLRSLLVPKYTQDLDDDEIGVKINKLRKKLTGVIQNQGRKVDCGEWKWQSKWVGPGLKELFVEGPGYALKAEYLEDIGIEPSYDGDEEQGNRPPEPPKPATAVDCGSASKATPSTKRSASVAFTGPEFQSPTPLRPKKHKLDANDNDREDRAEQWAMEAGLNETPKIAPTQRPKNPTEIVAVGDQVWLQDHLGKLESALFDTMRSYFQEHHIHNSCPAKFVMDPSPELAQLYKRLCGSGQWQAWVINQQTRQGVAALQQDYTLVGLMGAAIYDNIIMARPEWSLKYDIEKALGDNLKYVREVIGDLGHDLNTVLQYAVGKQIADTEFQEKTVTDHARKQAGMLAMTLQPHLQLLVKQGRPVEALGYMPWIQYLEKACCEALKIKQTLRVSQLGPFKVKWPVSGTKFDDEKHKMYFGSGDCDRVLHALMPTFMRKIEGGDPIVFSHALVIPTSSDTDGEASGGSPASLYLEE